MAGRIILLTYIIVTSNKIGSCMNYFIEKETPSRGRFSIMTMPTNKVSDATNQRLYCTVAIWDRIPLFVSCSNTMVLWRSV